MKTGGFLLSLLALASSAHAVVTLDWVTVGDPGNAADSTTYGAVGYTYQIMKYEVTNAQYAEFLNAKAATATSENGANDLYNTSMGSDALGGITRSGSSGAYTYSVKSGYENMPVVFVSHLDAQRFANWIHNGQGSGSTETGAYDLTTAPGTSGLATHNILSSNVWIPTEDEWYKASYYDPSASGPVADDYWYYSTRSDSDPLAAAPSGAPNSANYSSANPTTGSPSGTNYLSDVGAYSNSSSYYGTFDQTGNVYEWNEALFDVLGDTYRGLRGGSWATTGNFIPVSAYLSADGRSGNFASFEHKTIGFRLASSAVPEPSRALLLLAGAGAMLMRRRRLPGSGSCR